MSAEFFEIATKETIDAAIKLLKALGVNSDDFDFRIHPGERLLVDIINDPQEYLDQDMIKVLDGMGNFSDKDRYVTDLILQKKIEYPKEDENEIRYEWELVVTRNGVLFPEFMIFFNSFDWDYFMS